MNGFNYGYRHIPNDPMQMMYQQRLQAMQQQTMQPYGSMPMPSGLKGRLVTGRDEAKAAQIDLDGTPHYFDCPSEATIYKKSIGLDGMPVFEEYKRVIPQAQPKESNIIAALQTRIEILEQKLEGVYVNVKPLVTNDDTTAIREPSNNATSVGNGAG